MKKGILGLLVCFALCLTQNASAQTVVTMGGSAGSVVNTATAYNTLEVKQGYATVAIQTVITKVSGTVAGTVTLQGSIDGTNYETVDTNYVSTYTVTYTPTNVATNSKVWLMNRNPYQYYRIKYVGTGTMSATMTSYLVGKPN